MNIQQLEAELRVERFLNHLNNHIYGTVASYSKSAWSQNHRHEQVESEIFQIVVGELRALLGNGVVAIALPSTHLDEPLPGFPTSMTVEATTFKLCHLAPSNLHREAVGSQIPPSTLRLGSAIALNDLESMRDRPFQEAESVPWQIAHPIPDRQGIMGWLLAVQPGNIPVESVWTLEFKSTLVRRVADQCAIAIHRARLLQVDCPHCQKLEAQNRQLIRANQLKSEFLANTSHEIRTPLSSILGFTHLLLEQGYSPTNLRHQEYLNIILSSGQHLLALINDILDLSKVEANQLELQWEMITIPDLCHKVVALVKEKAYGKGLKLHLDLDPNATTFVADCLRLKQMLFNLLSNAIKFTPGGAVGLQVKQAGIFLHFTVWDTGIGISQEQQQQLFRPYSQIANAVVEANEGTGLGLALTQKLAKLHGGWVEIASVAGQGSQFTLVLPLTPKASPNLGSLPRSPVANSSPAANPVSGRKSAQKSKSLKQKTLLGQGTALNSARSDATPPLVALPVCRVLLVEDNLMNATLLITYLSKVGCEVVWAREAQEMWQMLEASIPDLILMDINLPQVDGLTLIQQIRNYSHYQAIPVIVQTAMAMLGDRETCLDAGATDYISKPINFEMLRQLVSQHTGRS